MCIPLAIPLPSPRPRARNTTLGSFCNINHLRTSQSIDMLFNQSSQDLMNTSANSGEGVQGLMHNPSLGLASRDASAQIKVAMLREQILQMQAQLDAL